MYRVIVNNGFLYDEVEYNSLYFDFDKFEDVIGFVAIIFQHSEKNGVEIIKLNESDNWLWMMVIFYYTEKLLIGNGIQIKMIEYYLFIVY